MNEIHKLDTNLAEIFKCENGEAGQEMVEAMGNIVSVLIDEMYELSEEWGKSKEFEKKCTAIAGTLKQYVDVK